MASAGGAKVQLPIFKAHAHTLKVVVGNGVEGSGRGDGEAERWRAEGGRA